MGIRTRTTRSPRPEAYRALGSQPILEFSGIGEAVIDFQLPLAYALAATFTLPQ